MKNLRILTMMLALFSVTPIFAAAQSLAKADRSWQTFWTQFSNAINTKNSAALNRLTASDRYFSLNGRSIERRNEWLAIIRKENLWSEYQRSIASGTKPYRCPGMCRMTGDNFLLFKRIGGRWQWTGLLGD